MSNVGRYLEPALVEQLRTLQLSARSLVVGGTSGQHRSPVKGASVEFRQHRFYVAGDEPRRLDWRVLARTDRPYVKEYDEETNLRAFILLDGSGSMRYGRAHGSKFDYAARLAAALSFLMLGQTESVGLALFSEKVSATLNPSAGPLQLARIISTLDRAAPAGASNVGRAMHEIADRLERRALVIVLSDFFTAPETVRVGLSHLRHGRHEVMAMQVTDRDEEEFPFRTWRRFRGLEGETPYLAEPALVRQAYLDRLGRHRTALRDACHSLKAEFEHLVTDQPLGERLVSVLRRRAGQPGI